VRREGDRAQLTLQRMRILPTQRGKAGGIGEVGFVVGVRQRVA